MYETATSPPPGAPFHSLSIPLPFPPLPLPLPISSPIPLSLPLPISSPVPLSLSVPLLLTEESVDIPLLRQQQIRLGLLKAARVLFSQQENLRQIMSRPAGLEDEQFSLFQQLLSAATRPSPIKAMFNRDELEVGVVSLIKFLDGY